MEIERVTSNLPLSASAATNFGTTSPVRAKDLASIPAIPVAVEAQAVAENQLLSSQEAGASATEVPSHEEVRASITDVLPIPDPFVGFVGHSFLHFCQAVDAVARWMKPRYAPAETAAQSLLSSPRSPWRHWGTSSLGMVCCTVMAALLVPLFSASSSKAFLPIPFLLIIVIVAFEFGRAAGVLGTMAAAFLFAWFLYEPAGLAVSDPVAKSHLIWMVIVGVLLSDLLARFRVRITAIRSASKHRSQT
jgi:hypothetical protein